MYFYSTRWSGMLWSSMKDTNNSPWNSTAASSDHQTYFRRSREKIFTLLVVVDDMAFTPKNPKHFDDFKHDIHEHCYDKMYGMLTTCISRSTVQNSWMLINHQIQLLHDCLVSLILKNSMYLLGALVLISGKILPPEQVCFLILADIYINLEVLKYLIYAFPPGQI